MTTHKMTFQNEENKLDWMYKGVTSLVDREDYLLGRKIDKTLELLNEEEKHSELGISQPKNHVEHECIPPSIRDYNKIQIGEQQVDLATKLQEDPLVAIKKREEETRKQFLQNPIQLKKLQSTLDQQLKKKKKKSKKQKNININALIAEKLQTLKNYPLNLSVLNNSADILNENNLDKILLKKLRKYKNYLSENDLKDILHTKPPDKKCTNSKESDNEDDNFIERNKSKSVKREVRSNQDKKKYTKPDYQNRGQYMRNNKGDNLTMEEKERRRREMMENAVWRETERSSNVKRYREEDAKESKTDGEYNPEFIHRELMKSTTSASVEKRIKSNINNIQRSKSDMHKNFSRRS